MMKRRKMPVISYRRDLSASQPINVENNDIINYDFKVYSKIKNSSSYD